MAIETPIVEWALDQLTKSPPMQSIAALVIVLLLAFPLIRGALKAVQPPPPPPATPIIQETPWLVTTLLGLQVRMDQIAEKQGDLSEGVESLKSSFADILRKQDTIAAGLAALTKLLRKRQGRNR